MILFVRVADMKYYQGITETDKPVNGGSYVNDTGNAHECWNFSPIVQNGETYEKCIGYFQMNGGRGTEQLHIEKIPGCELLKNKESVEGVTVVFVSKAHNSQTMRVVGFYKDATVYRFLHRMTFENGFEQFYEFEARKENCVVLPYTERFSNSAWYVPASNAKSGKFGFGRSNVWYAGAKGASDEELAYVEKMRKSIKNYNGENWMGRGEQA